MIRQLPLNLQPDPDFTLDAFVVAPSNQVAVNAISSWPRWAAPIMGLIGPMGSGKSHLGHAWALISGAKIYDGAQVKRGVLAVSGAPVFIDNADQSDETALFEILNLALSRQIEGLLLSSATPPNHWDIHIPDLRSRMVNVPVLTLDEPDDDILGAVIRKLFTDLGRRVPENLIEYILRYEDRSIVSLQNLCVELHDAATSEGYDLTRVFAAKYLKATRQMDFLR